MSERTNPKGIAISGLDLNPKKEIPITNAQLLQILEANSKTVEIYTETSQKYAEVAESLEEHTKALKEHDETIKKIIKNHEDCTDAALTNIDKTLFHLKVILSSTVVTTIITIIIQLLLK